MKEYIQNILQKILNKEFVSNIEKRIITHEDRLQMRCIYCHEGKTKAKKRGNLYLNKLLYICFRCDKKISFDRLCKDFDEQLDPDKKLEMIQHLDSITTYSDYKDDFNDARFENLINMSELDRVFNSNLTPISDFKPIQVNGGVYKYLIGRGIPPEYHRNIYQAKYWKNEDESEWIIIMLNRRDDKVLGMQVRNLKEGKRRMFKIYNYESLLECVNIGKEITEDINNLVIYNKLSYYFNILNIDFSKKITIFEGYIDSMFFPNSIGLVGINTDAKLLESNDLDIQYLFDNDEAGVSKSEDKIKKGVPVFLWDKLFDTIVNKKNVDDPYKLLHRISKVKDINKLSQLVSDPFSKLKLYDFFSKDIMDLKWIPKLKKMNKFEENISYNKKFDSFDKL